MVTFEEEDRTSQSSSSAELTADNANDIGSRQRERERERGGPYYFLMAVWVVQNWMGVG